VETTEQATWDRRYSGADLVWGTGPNRFVVAELAGLPAGRAIDLGAGEGRNAIWLAERGWQVTAVDFSAVGLARAARLAAGRGVSVEWVHADLMAWQPAPEGYDLVLVAYLQLPSAVLAPVLHTAAAAVAPGGTMLVIGHDRDNIARGYGGPQDPDRLYTPAEVAAGLGELVIRRAEQVLRPVQTPDGERTAIDTLVRAERPGVARADTSAALPRRRGGRLRRDELPAFAVNGRVAGCRQLGPSGPGARDVGPYAWPGDRLQWGRGCEGQGWP
jgi:SAM-dependent methyltransferase